MSADDLSIWLSGRKPAAPEALAGRIAEAVGNEAGAPPQTLAVLGARLLDRVATTQDRRQALDLLAAVALVTYAFEAQAEADVRGLTTLAERISKEQA